MGGCSHLLLFSTVFQCSLKAECLQGKMASAPAGLTVHLRSWPAAGSCGLFPVRLPWHTLVCF